MTSGPSVASCDLFDPLLNRWKYVWMTHMFTDKVMRYSLIHGTFCHICWLPFSLFDCCYLGSYRQETEWNVSLSKMTDTSSVWLKHTWSVSVSHCVHITSHIPHITFSGGKCLRLQLHAGSSISWKFSYFTEFHSFRSVSPILHVPAAVQ